MRILKLTVAILLLFVLWTTHSRLIYEFLGSVPPSPHIWAQPDGHCVGVRIGEEEQLVRVVCEWQVNQAIVTVALVQVWWKP